MRETLWAAYNEAQTPREKDRARNAIVVDQVAIVHEMLRRMRMRGADDYADLVQAGTIGLLRAVGSYDPSVGGWFGYASLWVRSEITEAVRKGKGHHFRAGREPEGIPVHDFFFDDMRYVEADGEVTRLLADGPREDEPLLKGTDGIPDLSILREHDLLVDVRDAMGALSDHERVIVSMATDGAPIKEIAIAACVSVDDVPGYLQALLVKLRTAAGVPS